MDARPAVVTRAGCKWFLSGDLPGGSYGLGRCVVGGAVSEGKAAGKLPEVIWSPHRRVTPPGLFLIELAGGLSGLS